MIQLSVSEALKILQTLKQVSRIRPCLNLGLKIPPLLATKEEELKLYFNSEVSRIKEHALKYIAIREDIQTLDQAIKSFNQTSGVDSLMRNNIVFEEIIIVLETVGGHSIEQALNMLNPADNSHVTVRVDLEEYSLGSLRHMIRMNQLEIAQKNESIIQVDLSEYSIKELGIVNG